VRAVNYLGYILQTGPGGGGGGGLTNINVSAGTTSNNLSNVVFSNSNGLSFGLNGSTITGSHNGLTSQSNQQMTMFATGNTTQSSSGTSNASSLIFRADGIVSVGITGGSVVISATQSNQAFSADASSTFQTIVFQDSNGISFSNNAGSLRITHALQFTSNTSAITSNAMHSTSRPAFSADASSTFQTLTLQNSNGVSFSNNAGAVRITHDLQFTSATSAITSAALHTSAALRAVYDGVASISTGTIRFTNANGVSFSINGQTISGSVAAQTNQTVGFYALQSTTAQSSSSTWDARSLSFAGLGIVSVGNSAGSGLVISATQSNQAFSAAGGSSAFQTLSFGDTNSVSFTNTNGSVGIASIKLQMFAVSNTTQSSSGTANHTALSFAGAGIASVGVTGGSVVISVPSGGGAGDGGVFAGVSTGGNTAGSTGTVSTGNFVLVGTNGITLSQSTGAAGSAATVTIQGWPCMSSFQNMENLNNSSVLTFGMTSLSQAVAFQLPWCLSASFLRFPVTMSTNSTTLATLASATATAQGGLSHTFNAVIYSLGTGASSKSLLSVTSGSVSMQFSQRISITNSTQYSISLGVSFGGVEGGAATNRTTQYSISNTNYSFTTQQIVTEWSGGRFFDIPLAVSLTPGPYWLVLGGSSSTSSAGAVAAGITNCHVRYSGHYGVSQVNVGFGVMGSTNLTSGGQLGNGFFSTAGGGTTSGFPISAISSTASNPIPYFQLLRSA
jgi:hypothetical protein